MDDDADGASPPCFAHHLVDGHPVDPDTARDVARFRHAQRARLMAARDLPPEDRNRAMAMLADGLDRLIAPGPGTSVASYWPIRGEPDLRPWMIAASAAGTRILLPVVVSRQQALEFRVWSPQCRMVRDVANIPVPAEGQIAQPDVVLTPLVGIDDAFHRLGNGDGSYDRTLARLDPRPRIIGIGFANCALPTIFPMPWDVPMDEVLLSDGQHLRR